MKFDNLSFLNESMLCEKDDTLILQQLYTHWKPKNNGVRFSKVIKVIYVQKGVNVKILPNLPRRPEGEVNTRNQTLTLVHIQGMGGCLCCEGPSSTWGLSFKSAWLQWRQKGRDPDKHSSLPSIVTYNTHSIHSSFPLAARQSNDKVTSEKINPFKENELI